MHQCDGIDQHADGGVSEYVLHHHLQYHRHKRMHDACAKRQLCPGSAYLHGQHTVQDDQWTASLFEHGISLAGWRAKPGRFLLGMV